MALVADGKHVLTDVFTSAGVVVGLVALKFTGWFWIDGTVAALVALHILFSGLQLLKQAFSGLMDASDPQLLEEIATLVTRHRKDLWIDVHRLRAWRSGNRVHIDFHLILPAAMSLEKAHAEVKEMEKLLADHFGDLADVLIHIDPCSDPECPICTVESCRMRKHPPRYQKVWKRETLTSPDELVSQSGIDDTVQGSQDADKREP